MQGCSAGGANDRGVVTEYNSDALDRIRGIPSLGYFPQSDALGTLLVEIDSGQAERQIPRKPSATNVGRARCSSAAISSRLN